MSAFAPDAVSIAALARMQIAARRMGHRLCLSGASRELRELLAFTGLDEVLGLESRREAEERKQGRGVQEEGELHELPP